VLPQFDGAVALIRRDVREDDVSGGSVHEIDDGAGFDVEAGATGRVGLREDDDVAAFEDAEVDRLIELMDQVLHDGQGFGDKALGGRVFERHAEDSEAQSETVIGFRADDVTALFEAEEHAEDFGNRALEPAGNVAFCETGGLVREEFEDVEAFFKGRSWVASFGYLQSVYARVFVISGFAVIVNRLGRKTLEAFHTARQNGI
jgi:hypothetical protein